MKKEQKIWGERWLVYEDSTHSTNILRVLEGYRCSWHRHAVKRNIFVVISGEIGVVVETKDPSTLETYIDEMRLHIGESFTVAPGLWHEFRAYQNSVVVEEMFVRYDEEDIERKNVGGTFDR